jgi:thiol-disulfide isomerase/thioredoxin
MRANELLHAVAHRLGRGPDQDLVPAQDRGAADDTAILLADEGGFSLAGATEWLNSPPLTAADLRGKVALVDFWTYTCINWLRSLPYLRAWHDRYGEQGLVVIGVHSPEFSFERDVENVRRAAHEDGITYPVAIDNDFAVWRSFDNHYWPALYFVDAHGRIRHQQFGEGAYEQSETVVRQLLREAGNASIDQGAVAVDAPVDAHGVEAAADWDSLRSPENYVGYARTENFASPGGVAVDEPRAYTLPTRLRLDHWALSGAWTMGGEAASADEADGRIAYRFQARDLHLVMGPAVRGVPVRFRVLIDGQPPGADHGLDVDDDGHGAVVEQRLHQLVRQRRPVAERTFEITFLDPGVQAYAFTFG